MNKRGNIFWGVTIAIFLYAMGIMFIPYLVDDITISRANLDCSNSSISDGNKITCLQTDLVIPYWIIAFLVALVGFIGGSLIK